MTDPSPERPEPTSEIILYQTEDGRNCVEVRLEDETVWLTQQLMAELFQPTKQNISLHLRDIYEQGELSREATVKESLTVRREELQDALKLQDRKSFKEPYLAPALADEAVRP